MDRNPCYLYETEHTFTEKIKVEPSYLVQYRHHQETKIFNSSQDMISFIETKKETQAELKKIQKQKRAFKTICPKCPAWKLFNKEPDPVYTYHHLTPRAKRKILSKTDTFLWVTGAKRLSKKNKPYYNRNNTTFCTLTLPFKQIHEDTEIKAVALNQFLIEVKAKYKVKYYLWKAEKTKAGSLHFHILFDRFIHWEFINTTWNKNINKLGYVDRYQEKFSKMSWSEYWRYYDQTKYKNDKRSNLQVWNAYQKGVKTNWKCPNSTDIHRLKEVKSLTRYVGKYLGSADTNVSAEMSKKIQTDKINGKIWGLSTALSSIKNMGAEMIGELQREFSYICEKFSDKIKNFDFSSVVLVTLDELIENHCFSLSYLYINNIKKPPE